MRLRQGPPLSVSRYSHVNQTGVAACQSIVIQTKTGECPGPKVFHQNICLVAQLERNLFGLRLVKVDVDVAFAGILLGAVSGDPVGG